MSVAGYLSFALVFLVTGATLVFLTAHLALARAPKLFLFLVFAAIGLAGFGFVASVTGAIRGPYPETVRAAFRAKYPGAEVYKINGIYLLRLPDGSLRTNTDRTLGMFDGSVTIGELEPLTEEKP